MAMAPKLVLVYQLRRQSADGGACYLIKYAVVA